MNATLRPMTLGEILDRSFQIYRQKFWAFIVISVIPALAMRIIYTTDLLTWNVRSHLGTDWPPGRVMANILISVGFYHFSSFFGMLVFPAFIHLTSHSILEKPDSLRSALRCVLPRWRNFLCIVFLKMFVVLLLPELIVLGILIGLSLLDDATGFARNLTGIDSIPIVAIPAFIGLLIFLWLLTCLSLTIPAFAVEQLRGFKSLRRSWQMSKGTRWRILVVWIILLLVSSITLISLQFILRQVFIFMATSMHSRFIVKSLFLPATYALNTAFSILIIPIYPIALTLFYYDQRIRLEGYDIERMMETAGMIDLETPPLVDGLVEPDTVEEQA